MSGTSVSADNVDVQKVTLTGKGTIHAMGMIFSYVGMAPSPAGRKVPNRANSEILANTVKIKFHPKEKEILEEALIRFR